MKAMSDVFTEALNAPAGRLAEVLLKKFVREVNGALPSDLRSRLDMLVDAPGKLGFSDASASLVTFPFYWITHLSGQRASFFPCSTGRRRRPGLLGRRANIQNGSGHQSCSDC